MCIICPIRLRVVSPLAGLWKMWFLPMLRGEMLPKPPSEPPIFHIRRGEQVMYTHAEQKERRAAYKVKKATCDKTMKVKCIVMRGMTQIVCY